MLERASMLKRWLGLASLVILLDQISKLWIVEHFVYGESLRILSVFDLVLAHNTGAAFSFLHDAAASSAGCFPASPSSLRCGSRCCCASMPERRCSHWR